MEEMRYKDFLFPAREEWKCEGKKCTKCRKAKAHTEVPGTLLRISISP